MRIVITDGGGNTGSTDQVEFNEPPPYGAAATTTTIHSNFMKHVVVTVEIILNDSILYVYIVYASYYGSDSMQ